MTTSSSEPPLSLSSSLSSFFPVFRHSPPCAFSGGEARPHRGSSEDRAGQRRRGARAGRGATAIGRPPLALTRRAAEDGRARKPCTLWERCSVSAFCDACQAVWTWESGAAERGTYGGGPGPGSLGGRLPLATAGICFRGVWRCAFGGRQRWTGWASIRDETLRGQGNMTVLIGIRAWVRLSCAARRVPLYGLEFDRWPPRWQAHFPAP